MSPEIDDRTIDLLAERLAAVLREELETFAARLAPTGRALTVEQVAERFGVARSTVYAHWREWGGYKLGEAQNTAIRFPPHALPELSATSTGTQRPKRARSRKRGAVLKGAPRFSSAIGEVLADINEGTM